MSNETETIDRLFLELSQFTTVSTGKELNLRAVLLKAEAQTIRLSYQLEKCGASTALTEATCLLTELRATLAGVP